MTFCGSLWLSTASTTVEQQLKADLQFSKPPARGVLAEDENELAIFQIQLFWAGRGVGSHHLGNLCAHKRRERNFKLQQNAKPGTVL